MTRQEPQFLVMGIIVAPYGIRGEVRVNPETDWPERYTTVKEIHLIRDHQPPVPVAVEKVWFHKNQMIFKLAGCDDRTAAEKMRGALLAVPMEQAAVLPEGHYFFHQIVGLQVVTTQGRILGEVSEVLRLPANDVYVVKPAPDVQVPGGREILLPATGEVVIRIDLDAGKMMINLLPGLLPEEENGDAD